MGLKVYKSSGLCTPRARASRVPRGDLNPALSFSRATCATRSVVGEQKGGPGAEPLEDKRTAGSRTATSGNQLQAAPPLPTSRRECTSPRMGRALECCLRAFRRGAHAGAEIWGKARSPGWNASRGTPESRSFRHFPLPPEARRTRPRCSRTAATRLRALDCESTAGPAAGVERRRRSSPCRHGRQCACTTTIRRLPPRPVLPAERARAGVCRAQHLPEAPKNVF